MSLRWAVVAVAGLSLAGCQLIQAAEEPTNLYQVSPKSTFEPNMPSVRWQYMTRTHQTAGTTLRGQSAAARQPRT